MADGVDIDLYSDDIDQNFTQMKVCRNRMFIDFMSTDMFFSALLILIRHIRIIVHEHKHTHRIVANLHDINRYR